MKKKILLALPFLFLAADLYGYNPEDLGKLLDSKNCPKCDLSGANFYEANRDDADSIESSVDQAKHLGSGESNKSRKIWISRFTQDPGELDMPKFGMFESRKEIRLDSSRVKRKLLVFKTSNQQRKIETRLDLPAVGFEKPATSRGG